MAAFRAFQVDVASLESWLSEVPTGKAFEATRSSWILELPMPDGEMEHFSVLNSPLMAPALAARYPEIQVFAGQGVDSPEATVRFDVTPQGFHAMILKEGETVYIDPYHPGVRDEVIVYTRSAFTARPPNRPKAVWQWRCLRPHRPKWGPRQALKRKSRSWEVPRLPQAVQTTARS